MTRTAISTLVLATMTAFTACGGCNEEPADSATGCVRDEAVLSERNDCFRDEDCACGSHCTLGLCESQCMTDSDCADGACNNAGFCIPAGETVKGRPFLADPEGRLVVDRTAMRFNAVGAERLVMVRSRDRSIGPFRAEVPDGFALRCEPDGDWLRECKIDELPADDRGLLRIVVRAMTPEAVAPGQNGELRIFAGRQFRRVGLASSQPLPRPLLFQTSESGTYLGTATLIGANFDLQGSGDVEDFRELSIAIQADVDAPDGSGRGAIRLSDPLDVLFKSGVVGELSSEEGAAADEPPTRGLALPSWGWLSPGGPGDVEVWAEPRVSDFDFVANTMRFTLSLELQGATAKGASLGLEWDVELFRDEDFAGSLSAQSDYLPQQADLPLAAYLEARTTTPLAFESLSAPVDLSSLPRNRQVQALLCTPSNATEPTFLSEQLVSYAGVLLAPGDLACDQTTGREPMPTVGLLGGGFINDSDTLTDCIADVESSGTGSCVDLPRTVTALAAALGSDRDRAIGASLDLDPTSSSLANRLVQQLVGVCSYMAVQADSDALSAIDESLGRALDDPFLVSDACGLVAELILAPRNGVPLSVMRPELLLEPDYRPRLFPNSATDYAATEASEGVGGEQALGLPVTLANLVSNESRSMRAVMRQLRDERVEETTVRERLGRSLRRSLLLLALGEGLHGNAAMLDTPVWEDDWTIARRRAVTDLSNIQREFFDAAEGVNQFGITDSDLPLYRIGDEVSPNERFSAISDYILGGAGLDTAAVAADFNDDATTALEEARTAWLAIQQRDLAARESQLNRDERVEALEREYGGIVRGLCGDPEMNARTVLQDYQYDSTCWEVPDCDEGKYGDEPDGALRNGGRNPRGKAAVGETLCKGYGLVIANEVELLAEGWEDILEDTELAFGDRGEEGDIGSFTFDLKVDPDCFGGDLLCGPEFVFPVEESGGLKFVTESFSWARFDALRVAVLISDLLYKSSNATYAGIAARCEELAEQTAAREIGFSTRRCDTPNECVCTESIECSPGYQCLPFGQDGERGCTLIPAGLTEADVTPCFRGAIGEAVLANRSAAVDIRTARAKVQELNESFRHAIEVCDFRRSAAEEQAALERERDEMLADLNDSKMHNDNVVGFVNTAVEVGAVVAQLADDSLGPKTFAGFGVLGVATTLLSFGAEAEANRLKAKMEDVEKKYEQLAKNLQAESDNQICLKEAEAKMIGIKSGVIEIEKAVQDFARAEATVYNLQTDLAAAFVEGNDAVARENSRLRPVLGVNYWIDEKIQTYQRKVRAARRAMYLAVLTVEYEFQVSSQERTAVRQASTPADLDAILDRLRAFSQTGAVAGSTPDNTLVVLSLKSDIQVLNDGGSANGATATERFQSRFQEKEVIGSDGQIIGWSVPFRLLPASVLDDPAATGLLSGTDCAERLWSVNASILPVAGQEADLFAGSDTTFTRITLRKKNTFFSQRCEPGAGDPLQVASTRPSRNLFVDPYDSEGTSAAATAFSNANSDPDGYTNARISAYFGVSRAELEDEQYFNGDSQELAGRGLFGDYELFFPIEILKAPSSSVPDVDGLDFSAIEDILLRFDYVSVAKNL